MQNMETVALFFDGYKQGLSIKEHEHERRVRKACADIQLTESMEAHVNQETFFSNEGNKAQEFISLLSRYLESDAQTVHNSTGDADTMIVSCALQMATEGSREVIVVADDTDVLILLMHHLDREHGRCVFPI